MLQWLFEYTLNSFEGTNYLGRNNSFEGTRDTTHTTQYANFDGNVKYTIISTHNT